MQHVPVSAPSHPLDDQPRLAAWTIWLERPWRVEWSPEVYDQYGLPRGSSPPTNENYFALVHPSDTNLSAREFRQMLAEGKQRSWRFRIIRQDGKIRHILTTAVPTMPPGGGGYVRGVDYDVTDLIDDDALFERERAYRFVADNVRDVVFRCSDKGRVEFVSKSVRNLLGFSPEELIGRPVSELLHPGDVAEAGRRFADQVARKRSSNKIHWEHRLLRKDGTAVWIECAPRLVFDSNARLIGWVDVIRDITARRASDQRIHHMARHDALTGLPNRIVLDERLEAELAGNGEGPTVAVLCLDLDRFKAVNDTLGHQAGDDLLRQVADRLRQTIGDCGGFVSRLGGDEFVAVIVGASKPAVDRLAEAVIASISNGYYIGEQRVDVGLSVGVAFSPGDATDAPGLLRAADIALYRAKAEGRGISCRFERRMEESRQARRSLEIELRDALGRNAFQLFYQPIVDIASGRPVAMEALLRWRNRNGILVLPASFIPIAEETGLIDRLGEWALREACRAAASWPEHLKVAVNLSPVQLRKNGLVATVVSALAQSGLPAERLELEITEGALIGDDPTTLKAMRQLKRLGVSIALDDFGTGYSSLGYLQKFPFDKLKIDGSFVSNLANSAEAKAIVRAVIALATALGMVTTGEGVETPEQLEALRREGCGQAQGNLLYPPLNASEVLKFQLNRKSTKPSRAARPARVAQRG
ncbi:MAG: EAL domain-containing protein [Pseudomonadota bacterium]|nr:EAL domain-containing protein [Pseudomonadota bacterium]